jgi:DNA-binding NarL/FixJ family response regulator
MPDLDGIEVARRLHEAGVGTAVVLYTAHADRALVIKAIDAGARGFLLKESPLSDLVRAVLTVAEGRTYVDPVLAGVLTGPEATRQLPGVTKREREVLRLLADGMRNEQIARELGISPLTVRTHIEKAMDKLEADTRTQAVANALRQSLIE